MARKEVYTKGNMKRHEKKEDQIKRLLEYMSDPEVEFPNRSQMSVDVLGYSETQTIYKLFTTLELSEIEIEAMEERKRRSAPQRAVVYNALLREAKAGNVQAMREFLDRTEGKVLEKKEIKIDGQDLKPILTVTLNNGKQTT